MTTTEVDLAAVETNNEDEKMIEVCVRFFTDKIAPHGKVLPKHAGAVGMVRATANGLHGIKTTKPVPFNSLMEISSAIEQVLINNGIKLHPKSRMAKYLAD
jgi:hypothetical protein